MLPECSLEASVVPLLATNRGMTELRIAKSVMFTMLFSMPNMQTRQNKRHLTLWSLAWTTSIEQPEPSSVSSILPCSPLPQRVWFVDHDAAFVSRVATRISSSRRSSACAGSASTMLEPSKHGSKRSYSGRISAIFPPKGVSIVDGKEKEKCWELRNRSQCDNPYTRGENRRQAQVRTVPARSQSSHKLPVVRIRVSYSFV